MEEQASAIGFREVDQNGNPVAIRTGPLPVEAGSRRGAAANPFIAALWLLAALLLGGGAWAISSAMANSMPVNGQLPVSYIALTFAPYFIVAGLAVVAGLLFWHAHQWQRRHA